MEWWVWLIIYIVIGATLEIITLRFAPADLKDDYSIPVILLLPVFWGVIVPMLLFAFIIIGFSYGIAKLAGINLVDI